MAIQILSEKPKKYLALMQNPDYQHIRFIRLTSPKHAEKFLEQIKAGQ